MKFAVLVSIAVLVLAGPTRADDHKMAVGTCDNKPVIMSVSGVTKNRDIMRQYAKALADSGIYATLRGYYINNPAPIAVFEGDLPKNHVTLLVRFPCFAHAKAFWYSEIYQKQVKPLRVDNDAGDYLVTVYNEIDVPGYMAGKVQDGSFVETFDVNPTGSVKQID
ncbi:MAG: hypothetical protein AAF607_10070 [Pseudomonadota bacterium]